MHVSSRNCPLLKDKKDLYDKAKIVNFLPLDAPKRVSTTARFSIGDVDRPTHATIVKGFHKYTRDAISPAGKISVIMEKKWHYSVS